MTMRRYLCFACVLTLIAAASGQEKIAEEKAAEGKLAPLVTKEQPMSFWMEKKLEYSKQILQALTSGDCQGIESNSEQMRLLGKIEGFVRRRSPTYTSHLQSFDLASRELTRHGREKNIEGATLAFHQLTTSCVSCHRSIREVSPSFETKSSK
ncbi:MAG: hypothetical protein SGI77_17110 [Pirellulaceae bacterium]|nr:hypothetical protein [Pirellulaceae bacterium]